MNKKNGKYIGWIVVLCLSFLLSSWTSSEARNFNVTGSVFYEDGDPARPPSGSDVPVLGNTSIVPGRMVKVSIVRDGVTKGSGYTDNQGYFSVSVSVSDNSNMGIMLEVDNKYNKVWADTDCDNENLRELVSSFSSGMSGDINIGNITVPADYRYITVGECLGAEDTHLVSFAGAMNINEVIMTTWEDIEENRDPDEGDTINQIYVEYCDRDWNHYASDIVLTCTNSDENNEVLDFGFVDCTIAHEYGHHLQYEIGNWDGHSGDHSLCREIDHWWWNEADFAWAEGFPDYLGGHITHNKPGMSTIRCGSLEDVCGSRGSGVIWKSGGEPEEIDSWYAVEGHIAGVLWDLADGLGRGDDAWDIVNGSAINGHGTIIQIFDRELGGGALDDAPDLRDFYNAWVERKGKTSFTDGQPALDMILNRLGIVPFQYFPLIDSGPKMAPYGFIELNPILPTETENNSAPGGNDNDVCESGETCVPEMYGYYNAVLNRLELQTAWSYIDSGGSLGNLTDPIIVRIGVSNLAPGTMGVSPFIAGSPNQAYGAFYNTTIDWASQEDFTDWLSLNLLPGGTSQLTQLVIELLPDAITALPRGEYVANINVEFHIQTMSGAFITQDKMFIVRLYILDSGDADADLDGLTNKEEINLYSQSPSHWHNCLNPRHADSDDDRLWDGEEVNQYDTNPCDADTDHDGNSDKVEVDNSNCLDPLVPNALDADGDGLTNEEETEYYVESGLDPCNADTDGDGYNDSEDNCPIEYNPKQEDWDGDGIGYPCDHTHDLSDWIKEKYYYSWPIPLPYCGIGCDPLPEWFKRYPWDDLTRFAMKVNGVKDISGDTNVNLRFDGESKFCALGSKVPGKLKLTLVQQGGYQVLEVSKPTKVINGTYALLIDADGNELWRLEGLLDITDFETDIKPESTYFLIINGPPGSQALLTVDLPGSDTVECETDDDCEDDGLFCNGEEICVEGSCMSEGNPCPGGAECIEETDACRETTTTTKFECLSKRIYGEHSKEIELLKYLRDDVLSRTPEGQEIIKLYYEWSPVIVRAMEADEEFQEDVKEMIDGILPLIWEEID